MPRTCSTGHGAGACDDRPPLPRLQPPFTLGKVDGVHAGSMRLIQDRLWVADAGDQRHKLDAVPFDTSGAGPVVSAPPWPAASTLQRELG